MQLKKLIVCGFKSFADKTEFQFDGGITVVVGPNGCGKSNVVDSIKWVLGAQSAKSLRGSQMLDVIFNGSGTRKSMGFAEVSLVFDNTSRTLPTDHDEVAVTRKLFRSGESVYMMNGKNCRLKDVREMFMDTGIGADAYSIIEQGKVESLLQASPDDRRAIFEEAAGISKYKARKKEAIRKLDRTEQNVLRLQDIIGELEKRLRSIKYQASKARSYQSHVTRLRELRLNQYLSEYNQLQVSAKATEEKSITIQDRLVVLTASVEKGQAQLSVFTHELDQTDNEIRHAESQLLQCTSQISTQEDRVEFGRQRCQELQEMLSKNRNEIQTLRQRHQALQEDLAADQNALETLQANLDEQQEQLKQHQNVRQQSVLELNEYRAQLEDEKSGVIDIVRRTANLHNEIKAIDIRCDGLHGQKGRLQDRSGQINSEIEEILPRQAQFNEKLDVIRQLQQESQIQLDAKREQLAHVNEDALACNENLSASREYRSGLLSRQQVLTDMESKLEGVDQGVKQILEAKNDNADDFYYIRGMVAETIRADVKYAAIVEAALSEKSQYLVADTRQDILNDQERLGELKGRVQMISLEGLPEQNASFDFGAYPKVKAQLIDLVSCPQEFENLSRHLLGKTLLVEKLADAFELAQIVQDGYRWVTLAGEVLEADGTVHIGPQTAQMGLISRKSELRELEKNITESEERIRELKDQAEQFASQAEHLEKNRQELRTAIYEARTEEVETRGQLDQIERQLNRLTQEQPLVDSEISGIEEQIQMALQQQVSSQGSLDELNNVSQQRQDQIDHLEEQIDVLQSRDQEELDQITNMKVALGQAQQKTLALRERIASIKSQLQQVQHSMENMQSDLNNAQENITVSERAILTAESKISELFLARQEHQTQSRALRDKRNELQELKDQLTDQSREETHQREELQEKLHNAQMRFSENKLKCENLVQRAREDLQIDLAEKIKDHELQEMDWDAVTEEINELRDKINRLGNINLDAITEQEELEERAVNLNAQATDLADSKKQLEELIEKINIKSVELFRSSFEAIRVNFSDLFRKLFGGGRAEIVLEDPDDILECGIEIIARPPGKQLQSISLLSGGEKTMTAVALLMAIFKSKPSPFCLLDEVDAALDEANNERFNLVVQEFLTDSQFVIITHSRRTMSVANVIYGVTMQEQGVSKKVAVRFAGSDDDEDTAVA